MVNKEKALSELKTLLGFTDESADAVLLLVIEECMDRVLGYCRVEEYPQGLESLLPIMAHRAYLVGGYGRADPTGSVTSVKQGERSVSYEGASAIGGDWILDFADRLEPFRRRRGKLPSECV